MAQDFLDGLVRYAHAVEVGRKSAPEAVPAKPQDPVLVQLERMLQFLIVVIDPAVPTLLARLERRHDQTLREIVEVERVPRQAIDNLLCRLPKDGAGDGIPTLHSPPENCDP